MVSWHKEPLRQTLSNKASTLSKRLPLPAFNSCIAAIVSLLGSIVCPFLTFISMPNSFNNAFISCVFSSGTLISNVCMLSTLYNKDTNKIFTYRNFRSGFASPPTLLSTAKDCHWTSKCLDIGIARILSHQLRKGRRQIDIVPSLPNKPRKRIVLSGFLI